MVVLFSHGLTSHLQIRFETKMTGEVPSNAFAGSPGDWLGLEIDVVLQHHFAFSNWGGMDIGLEAAWLQPGDAFIDATGNP